MTTAMLLPLVMMLAPAGTAPGAKSEGQAGSRTYSIVVEGYDWGAGVSKAILAMDKTVSSASARDYSVAVRRSTDCGPLPPEQSAGERVVVDAYVSDEKGARRDEATTSRSSSRWPPVGAWALRSTTCGTTNAAAMSGSNTTSPSRRRPAAASGTRTAVASARWSTASTSRVGSCTSRARRCPTLRSLRGRLTRRPRC